MNINNLGAFCKRIKVFVSYAKEDKALAKEITMALEDENCEVFFDEKSIISGNYRKKIKYAIDTCDVFIFLVSQSSLDSTRFAQAELSIAKKRFKAPSGRVIPVILDDTISINSLNEVDYYLTSTHVIRPLGNLVFQTVNAVNDIRTTRPFCKILILIISIFLISSIILAVKQIVFPNDPQLALRKPDEIEFRSFKDPPDCRDKNPSLATDWFMDDFAITAMKMTYLNRSSSWGKKIRILDTRAKLYIGSNDPIHYGWFRLVDTSNDAPGVKYWINYIGEAEPFTLEAGSSRSDELLFKPRKYKYNLWGKFIKNQINNEPPIKIIFETDYEFQSTSGTIKKTAGVECKMHLTKSRQSMLKDFSKDKCKGRIPSFFYAYCK